LEAGRRLGLDTDQFGLSSRVEASEVSCGGQRQRACADLDDDGIRSLFTFGGKLVFDLPEQS